MKKILGITFVVLLVIIFFYTLYYLYSKNREPEVKYNTATPYYTDIVEQTVATGSVVPRKEILIKPQISGIVQKIFVKAGDKVKAGDVVARIQVIPDMVNLNTAENRLERARINYDNAKIDYERNKTLFEKGVISAAQFQQFELDFRTARQELNAAEDNLQIIREGVSKKASQASNTLIRSTIDGTILDVPVEEGNSVIETNTFNEGTTIASVADLSDMIFEGNVDESEVAKLQPGMDIVLNIGAIEDETHPARLEYIAPKGVEKEGAIYFEIRAALELREGTFIRAGYSANANIVLNRKDSVMSIKESYLNFSNDSVYVEVKKGDHQYERRPVTLGISDGINIEVLSGLDMNDQIKDPNAVID